MEGCLIYEVVLHVLCRRRCPSKTFSWAGTCATLSCLTPGTRSAWWQPSRCEPVMLSALLLAMLRAAVHDY